MTGLFFVFAVLTALLSYNVIKPQFHRHKLIAPSFLAGWLTGELAPQVIAVQVLIVALFAWCGAIAGFWGMLALMLCVGAWLALSYHYLSGYKAKVVMESIVGPHRKPAGSSWSRHDELDFQRLSHPFADFRSKQIELIKDIPYAEVDGMQLKLDIRRNLKPSEDAPVLIQIHGGGWTHGYGSKNEQGIPLTVEMAKRGWVCVNIAYRLAPKFSFPDQIHDCKRALAWAKEHISEYGGNPDYIVITGGSAGGHLSSLMGVSANVAEFQPGFEEVDTRIQGCVPFYGIYDLLDKQKLQLSPALSIILRRSIIKKSKEEAPELYELMSPISHINAEAPPFLLIHGDKDSLTSLAEAQYFASKLDGVSKQSVEFAEIPGAQHAFDAFVSLRSDYVMLGIAERLEQWHRDFQTKQ